MNKIVVRHIILPMLFGFGFVYLGAAFFRQFMPQAEAVLLTACVGLVACAIQYIRISIGFHQSQKRIDALRAKIARAEITMGIDWSMEHSDERQNS